MVSRLKVGITKDIFFFGDMGFVYTCEVTGRRSSISRRSSALKSSGIHTHHLQSMYMYQLVLH